MTPWRDPFLELEKNIKNTVQHMITATVIFGVVISLIALAAIGISGFVLHDHYESNKANIQRNQDTIVALCRELNERDIELKIAAIDLGVPPNRLTFLTKRPCKPDQLRKKFGAGG
jgi:hypothetical protein